MIDNVMLVVTGALHERDINVSSFLSISSGDLNNFFQELLAKCHPLGLFDSIASLAVSNNIRYSYLVLLRYNF